MAVISIISVNIIAPLITFFEIGFKASTWLETLKVIPFIWLTVIVLVNILFSVLLMSMLLTVIGTWIGNREISLDPIRMFFYKWPRNFSISLFVEACIAQPIARFVMLKLHTKQAVCEIIE